SLEVALFVDTSLSMSLGDPEKFSYSRSIAAAFAFVALRRLEGVRVIPCGGPLAPRAFHGSMQIAPALEHLASLSPETGPPPLRGIRSIARSLRARGLALVLSDFYDADATEAAVSYLAHLRFRTFAIHIVSRDEVAPSLRGRVRLRDVETGRALVVE